jgi:hypothetical protein
MGMYGMENVALMTLEEDEYMVKARKSGYLKCKAQLLMKMS